MQQFFELASQPGIVEHPRAQGAAVELAIGLPQIRPEALEYLLQQRCAGRHDFPRHLVEVDDWYAQPRKKRGHRTLARGDPARESQHPARLQRRSFGCSCHAMLNRPR